MKNKKISRRATATCSTCNAIKRVLGSVLCAALIVCQTVPVLATDEYGDPIVTATPVPDSQSIIQTIIHSLQIQIPLRDGFRDLR